MILNLSMCTAAGFCSDPCLFLGIMIRQLCSYLTTCSVYLNASTIFQSNDRNRMSEQLTEEAEKYFEDFFSNVEDTDISSFDGERSDASSTLGVIKTRDSVLHFEQAETFQSPAGSNNCPVEMDGVILPWLQWETGNDGSPLPSKNKREFPVTPKSILWDAAQVTSNFHVAL